MNYDCLVLNESVNIAFLYCLSEISSLKCTCSDRLHYYHILDKITRIK